MISYPLGAPVARQGRMKRSLNAMKRSLNKYAIVRSLRKEIRSSTDVVYPELVSVYIKS